MGPTTIGLTRPVAQPLANGQWLLGARSSPDLSPKGVRFFFGPDALPRSP